MYYAYEKCCYDGLWTKVALVLNLYWFCGSAHLSLQGMALSLGDKINLSQKKTSWGPVKNNEIFNARLGFYTMIYCIALLFLLIITMFQILIISGQHQKQPEIDQFTINK